MATSSTLQHALHAEPHLFLTPTPTLHEGALNLVNSTLSPVAADLRALHQARLAAHREERQSKRKRDLGEETDPKRLRQWDESTALRLGSIHTKGFGVEQVWEQVRRIVDGLKVEVERDLAVLQEQAAEIDSHEEDISSSEDERLGAEGLDYEVEGVDDDEDARPSDDESEAADPDDADPDESLSEGDDTQVMDDYKEDDISGEDMALGDGADSSEAEQPAEEYVKDAHGLNDGFFSIDDFNKQAAFLESADMRGEDDGAASDEEDVDWDADPATVVDEEKAPRAKKMPKGDDDDEDGGPTFGNMDLDAPEGASDDDDELEGGEMDDLDDGTNANGIMYADFFAPPARKASRKNKKGRPHPSQFPATSGKSKAAAGEAELDEQYNEGALSRVHRDLFSDDEADDEPVDGDDSDAPASHNLSTHERNQKALQKQIRALEATLVSAKPWALAGEASSHSRPMNSLLEEDLAFERAGKPVPIVTAELSASIEDLIRARIVAADFQDVARRRPDDLVTSGGRRGAPPELDDTKSKRSLAQLYEDEHARATTGATDADRALDAAQAKEQAAISNLWLEVRAQLDSLSNFSLRPRAPTVSLEIRADVPVAQMEDARPTVASAAGDGMGGVETSALAPGEVYRVGKAAADGEDGERLVGGRKGMVVAREEMDREDGKRARRRAKERARKRGGLESGKAKETAAGGRDTQRQVLGNLKKGGVKVIGKKGELTDVEGRRVEAGAGGPVGGGAYKL